MLTALIVGLIADPVRVSFAFFGCNRIDKKDYEKIGDPKHSSANVPQLLRTFQDIANLKPVPSLVFGAGDLVMNYADDQGQTLRRQMEGWRKLAQSSPLYRRSTILPFPGNHELDKKPGEDRLPNPITAKVWADWYKGSGFKQPAANGPKVGDPDQPVYDQSTLNYWFDRAGVRFVVLNTDTLLAPSRKIAQIPIKWVENVLRRANADPTVRDVFVMGHRNLIDPKDAKGDAPIDREQGESMRKMILANPKVRAFICSHVHAFDLSPLAEDARPWQVVLGNGGSKLEKDWEPEGGTYFGFGVFDVHESGRVVLRNFRRPTPKKPLKYFEGTPPPAQPTNVTLYDPRQ